jgi:hypothetical protein
MDFSRRVGAYKGVGKAGHLLHCGLDCSSQSFACEALQARNGNPPKPNKMNWSTRGVERWCVHCRLVKFCSSELSKQGIGSH